MSIYLVLPILPPGSGWAGFEKQRRMNLHPRPELTHSEGQGRGYLKSRFVFSYTLLGFRKLLPPGRDLGDNEPGGLLDGFYSL